MLDRAETYVTEIRGCDYFRRNPWACKAGVELKAVNPVEGDPAAAGDDVNSNNFPLLSQAPRAACPVACGTCPARACDDFPCKEGSVCEDMVSDPTKFTDASSYGCICGESGFTGTKCDEDFKECYEQPCGDNGKLQDGVGGGRCRDSVRVAPASFGVNLLLFKCFRFSPTSVVSLGSLTNDDVYVLSGSSTRTLSTASYVYTQSDSCL